MATVRMRQETYELYKTTGKYWANDIREALDIDANEPVTWDDLFEYAYRMAVIGRQCENNHKQ